MRFYPKQLNSLDELKKEQRRLRAQRKKTGELEDLLPGKRPKEKQAADAQENAMAATGLLATLTGLLGGGTPVEKALSLAGPLMDLWRAKRKRQRSERPAKSLLGGIAKDILISYALGKSLRLAAKGFKKYRQKRQERKLLAEIEALAQKAKR